MKIKLCSLQIHECFFLLFAFFEDLKFQDLTMISGIIDDLGENILYNNYSNIN